MARVRSFRPSSQDLKVNPTEVDCEYQLVADEERRYLNLSTFGSDHRKAGRKSSQNIQLDHDCAWELIEVIVRFFPDLDDRDRRVRSSDPDGRPEQARNAGAAKGLVESAASAEPAAQNTKATGSVAEAVIDAAARSIATHLESDIRSHHWSAVLARVAELLHTSGRQ